ncbi:hypothetical protein AAFC00_002562 [Neodothiora populina]|uniref:GRIP domain-containing protein n=1 Tax=Neodothiora populina TaxID=2781224 RepID=A0ABR3P7G8_9PEZI
MSATNASDPVSKSAAKKKRKNKKKVNDKSKDAGDNAEANGLREDIEKEGEGEGEGENEGEAEAEVDDVEVEVTDDTAQTPEQQATVAETTPEQPVPDSSTPAEQTTAPSDPSPQDPTSVPEPPLSNGIPSDRETAAGAEEQSTPDDTAARLEAMTTERDELRAQVAALRKSLETTRHDHQGELTGLREEVEDAKTAKENAELQYRTLLGKVNTIRSQLGERLKADAEELSQARTQLEELQEETRSLREINEDLQNTIVEVQAKTKEQEDELELLRSRTNLSQTNWAQERDELLGREAYAKEEFESARQAMQDWEVLAMEERSLRESLSDKVAELEDQLNAQREAYERAVDDRDTQSATVDGLQRALQEIQEARKRELREVVENSQTQLEALRSEAETAKSGAAASAAELKATKKELERALPFEKEVKEKNLLIGKLRHEAVILNDHLTKALRFLKRGKPEDNVDRQIVTNHFLHFLMLDRSDPKKFQVLQLIAALLGWTEEQREQAGLARPGASNAALRVPLSPFRRTPSTPSLSSDFMPDGGSNVGSKESLAELWSDFLEREAQEGGGSSSSRAGSVVGHGMRSPTITSPTMERQMMGFGKGH